MSEDAETSIERHEAEKAEAVRLYDEFQAVWIDHADDMRVIATKRGEYFIPARSGRTWQEHRPGKRQPAELQDHKFWPTPEGWVIARLEAEPDDR